MSTIQPVVFVVDDDVTVRESLEGLLQSAGWRTEGFASAEAFLEQPRVHEPSCLVLDVTLPKLSGFDLQAQLTHRIELPVIFISGFGDVPTTVKAMKAGAVDFLLKPVDDGVLLQAIQLAIAQSHAAISAFRATESLRERQALLSRRERQVMRCVVCGLSNKQAGAELGISEITVKAHRGQVMRKMQAHSLAELVKMAAELGIALN